MFKLGKLIYIRPLDSALVVTKDAQEIRVYLPNEPDDVIANDSAVLVTMAAIALKEEITGGEE